MRERLRLERKHRQQAEELESPPAAAARPAGQLDAAQALPGAGGPQAVGHSFGGVDVVPRAPAGQPLPADLQARYQSSLGVDLAGVRVHAGPEAAPVADGMQARAVTVGQDIHFGAGQYQPGSAQGQVLLAHEVVHAAQQADAAAVPPAAGAGARVTGSLETEAAALAVPLARGIPVRVSVAPALAPAAVGAGVETAGLEDLDLTSHPGGAPDDFRKKQVKTARGDKDATHRNVTIFNANYVGGNERSGALHEVPTIHIGPTARAAGGETLMQLQLDYNDYVPLLHSTLRAMGRLKDLDNAGAKLDPEALRSDPALAAKFKPLEATKQKDNDRIGDFDSWSGHATEESIAVASMGAGFQQLKAAISGFRAAESMLKRRQKEAKLAGAEDKKAAIDQKIDTLVKIVDTCFKAVEIAGNVEAIMSMSSEFNDLQTVEGPGGKTSTMTKQQSEGWENRTKSVQQSLGSGAAALGEQLKKRHTQVESWAKSGGITLKNVFLVASGDAKEYEELTQQISSLKNGITQLGFDIETRQISEAQEQLDGMKLEVGVRTRGAAAKQGEARASARTFGQGVGGNEGALAMYAAQAYQDLALFGGEADKLRRARIDRYIGWLFAFVKDSPYVAEGHGWYEDWITLRDWGQQMVEQRDFFSGRVPEWKQKSAAWNDFFATMTGGGLMK
jgi:hypothetical protein